MKKDKTDMLRFVYRASLYLLRFVYMASLYLLTFSPLAGAQTPTPPTSYTTETTQALPTPTPLTVSQKLAQGAKDTFLSPGSYVGPAVGAYFTQRRELRVAAKTTEDYFADGLGFYARSLARRSTAQFLTTGLFPALFKQDPRYFSSTKQGFGGRLGYAISRTWLTQSDTNETQFNYSKLAGIVTSSALANAYERNTARTKDEQGRITSYHQRTGAAATFRNVGFQLGQDVARNVLFNEFRIPQRLGNAVKKIFGK